MKIRTSDYNFKFWKYKFQIYLPVIIIDDEQFNIQFKNCLAIRYKSDWRWVWAFGFEVMGFGFGVAKMTINEYEGAA